jgi:hypothetical protein
MQNTTNMKMNSQPEPGLIVTGRLNPSPLVGLKKSRDENPLIVNCASVGPAGAGLVQFSPPVKH